MQRRHTGLVLLPVLALFAAGPLSGQMRTASHSAGGPHYVGVIGQVARPGVYEQPGSQVTLDQVIGQAGGLTEAASHDVRIVRGGRGGLRVYYTPQAHCPLLPGDLVIVDERPTRTVGHAVREGKEVQLALVDLIERPVVLKVKAEHANVGAIVSLLGQSEQLAKVVRVIPAGGTRSFGNPPSVPNTPLASGSVLVFHPAVVRQDRLPTLPGPRLVTPADGEQPVAAGRRDSENLAGDQGVDARRSPELRTVPSAAEHSSAPALAAPVRPEPPPQIASMPPEEGAVAPRRPSEEAKAGVVGGQEFTPAQILVRLVGTMVGLMLLAWGIGRLWKRRRLSQPPAGPERSQIVEPPPQPTRNPLDALINNELPLTEEPVRLPSRLEFYGRPAAAPVARIDAAHDLPASHLSTPVREAVDGPRVESPVPSRPAVPPHSDRPRGSSGGEQASRLLERALMSMHGARQK